MARKKKLPDGVWCERAQQLEEAYLPYLQERYPMGSVACINLLTAEYVVGENSPNAMELYAARFGKCDGNACLSPIFEEDTRSKDEQWAAVLDYARRYEVRGKRAHPRKVGA